MTILALFFTCFLAATVIPFSSELAFIYALEDENVLMVVVAASIGNWLGGMLTFWLGWLAKWNWIEKYLKVSQGKVESTREVVQKYGAWMGAVCWMPFVGDIVAIGLGVFRVSPLKTSISMLIGKTLRYVALVFLLQ